MNEDEFLKPRQSSGRQARPTLYTARDFQLEVLDRLAETQALTEASQEAWRHELKLLRELNSPLKFDPRTLVAMLAIALSITGYALQDARNTSKRDAEIETMKVRVTRLEQIAATNTEARVRTEVQLEDLHEGQAEIKEMIEAHGSGAKKAFRPK
jgi:hypothetical protein